jgi:hypothetical protein
VSGDRDPLCPVPDDILADTVVVKRPGFAVDGFEPDVVPVVVIGPVNYDSELGPDEDKPVGDAVVEKGEFAVELRVDNEDVEAKGVVIITLVAAGCVVGVTLPVIVTPNAYVMGAPPVEVKAICGPFMPCPSGPIN